MVRKNEELLYLKVQGPDEKTQSRKKLSNIVESFKYNITFLRSVYSFYIVIQNIIKKVKYKLAKGKRPVKRISQFAFEIVQFLKIELHSTFKYQIYLYCKTYSGLKSLKCMF